MAAPALASVPKFGRRSALLWLGLIALHGLLWCGVFQSGFTRDQVHALLPPGPYKLIAPYVAAAQRDGPIGVVRVYFFGESDDRLYLEYARLVLHGEVDLAHIESVQKHAATHGALPARPWPYRDVTVEYPPLALLAMLPPALFSTEYAGYRGWFAAFMLLLHLANLALAFHLLRLGPSPQPISTGSRLHPITWLLTASLVWSLLLGRIAAARMDHVVVTWALVTLWAGSRALAAQGSARARWAALSGVLAACGVMTKLVPGLALLALLIVWLCSQVPDRVRLALTACAAGGVALAGANALMFVFAGDRYLDTFRYHTLRGVQIESLYAGVLLLLHAFGLRASVSESFGSTNLDSCFTHAIQVASPWLFVLACVGFGLRRWSPEPRSLVALTLALLLAFVLAGRVFSPQYLIWIAAPLLAAGALDRPRGPWRVTCALFLCLCLVSQLIYPQGYPVLKAFHPLAVTLLNLRNLGIVLLCALIVRAASTPRLLQRNT
jgi:4-amino-4-deoxy-L-arabinose transferase-like glycosyltransferase